MGCGGGKMQGVERYGRDMAPVCAPTAERSTLLRGRLVTPNVILVFFLVAIFRGSKGGFKSPPFPRVNFLAAY